MNPAAIRRRRSPVRSCLALLAAVALLAAAAPACAQPAAPKKIATVEGITEYQLDNGARVLLFPDPASSTVTVNMTVRVGSRHEGYGETGMAHLLEHMLFKGTPTFPDPFKALQARTRDYNAITSYDRTNYYETMPATEDNLRFGIELESDRLTHSHFKREDLVKEMTVVRNEFEQYENNPGYILTQRMMAVAFEWHNYGKTVIGNRSDIERVPIEKLQAFYRKYYQPDNAVLVVAGKFDEAKALEFVTKYLAPLPRPKRELDKTYTDEPAQDGERTVTLRRVGKVPLVGLMYHVPAAAHPDYAAVEVLASVIGSSPSGRLYKALVEGKKATSVAGSGLGLHDPGLLSFDATVADKATAEEVRDLMTAVVENFKKQPFTDEEVERARRTYLAERERVLASSTSTATELSDWIGAGDWRLLFIHRDRVARVTPQDVMRVAEAYLKQTNRTTGMYLPTTEVVRATIPQTPSVTDLVKDYKGGAAVAAGEQFDPTNENIEKRIRRTTLPGGVKVALLPKKTRGETVVVDLTLRFGNAKSLTGWNEAADLVGSMLTMGTKKYTQQQLADELDKLKATLSTDSGLGGVTASIQAKRSTLPQVLELLRECLRAPTFPQDKFDLLKASYKQAMEKAQTEPNALGQNALIRKLNPYPPGDVRYIPTYKELIGHLDKVTRDQVVKLYQEQLGGTSGELVIVGDFDADAVLKQMSGILDDWKSPVSFERIRYEPNLKAPAGTENILTPDKESAYYYAGYQFKLTDTAPDYLALRLGNYILGGGTDSRLFDRLRVKDGLSYGAGSSLSVSSQPEGKASFTVNASCKPENIDKADKAAREELNKILKDGVSKAELDNAIKGYLEELKVARADDGELAGMLSGALHLGRTQLYYAEQERRIAKLTPEQVNAALRAHLHPDRLVVIRAGDFKKK
jgi:zinc protease